MNFPPQAVPAWLGTVVLVLLAPMVAIAWREAAARLRRRASSPHLLGALVVALALLWLARAGPIQGSTVNMLGAALALFLLDAPLALLAMGLVALLDAAFGASPWTLAPLNALMHGVVPVLLARIWLTLVERRLPANLFVYLFVGVFFGTALTSLATTLASSMAVWLLTGIGPDGELLVALILAEGEALLTGMLMTVFVVYRPQWVATFDDERYLHRRGSAADRIDP